MKESPNIILNQRNNTWSSFGIKTAKTFVKRKKVFNEKVRKNKSSYYHRTDINWGKSLCEF